MIMYKIPKSLNSTIPLYFRLLQAWNIIFQGKGIYFIRRILLSLGLLNKASKFKYFKSGIYIPLDIPDTIVSQDFSLYHGLREINFANFIYRHFDDFVLIDCGCAYGQISMRLANICPNINSIIAIDPNRSHCEITNKNLSLTKVKFQIVNSAVSDFTGKGSLIFPNGEHDSHAAYIEKDDHGDIDVITIDGLVKDHLKNVALKLDVEGQEIQAINGAKKLIKECGSICFFIEIHPVVLERNNEKGEDILKLISSIRPIKWYLAENPMHIIDEHQPFFAQVKEKRQFDVIGVSE